MNERLIFSWSHIFALVALIAVSYTSFVGFTYLTLGDFTLALIGMAVTDVVYILVFIGAQQLKAAGSNMRKKIRRERFLILVSPLVFVVGMVSMSHFWTVKSRNDAIVSQFTGSIDGAKGIFKEYEEYADRRLGRYEAALNAVVPVDSVDRKVLRRYGFEEGNVSAQKVNMVETLRLQLLSENYDRLKASALDWIEGASDGANTWNVFLLGNTREIKSAIQNWENQLKSFSTKENSNESIVGDVLHFNSESAETAVHGIDEMNSAFSSMQYPGVATAIFGAILYMMLLFPYLLQRRHSKSNYTFFGKKKGFERGITIPSDFSSKNIDTNGGSFRL